MVDDDAVLGRQLLTVTGHNERSQRTANVIISLEERNPLNAVPDPVGWACGVPQAHAGCQHRVAMADTTRSRCPASVAPANCPPRKRLRVQK